MKSFKALKISSAVVRARQTMTKQKLFLDTELLYIAHIYHLLSTVCDISRLVQLNGEERALANTCSFTSDSIPEMRH